MVLNAPGYLIINNLLFLDCWLMPRVRATQAAASFHLWLRSCAAACKGAILIQGEG